MSDMTSAVAIETLRANYPDACYEQLREAVDAAIEALKAQDAAGDTISREAVIDAIFSEPLYKTGMKKRDADAVVPAIYEKIKSLPSAQPEKRTEERTKTHACDLISRQTAIDAHYEYCNKHPDAGFPVWSLKILENLPSEQPEPCDLCSNLEKGDTLYQNSDWDGGIGFDYIWDIQYCPKCGRRLE